MTKWLRDGLEGRNLKAVLCLYIFGLVALTLVVVPIGLLFGAQTAFQVTPLLVVLLGGIEYSICYLYPLLRDRNLKRWQTIMNPSLQKGKKVKK
ncbi:hypothetical protein FJZ31_01420 [Candidatus Poribacteria bacterium]|nr:hypothetical protein [Candidatus Poribacteria bacterium]